MLTSLCLLLLLLFSFDARAACPLFTKYETARVKKVIDGDTVHLADGRRIRFIGIDAPELYKNGRFAPEPGARKARQWLRNKFPKGSRMKLVFASKRRDDYGRLLAYPLTNDGQLLVKNMLAAGVGELMLFEPNHRYWSCLLQAEQHARGQQQGIWSAAIPAAPVSSGWQHLLVTVQGINTHRHGVTLMSESGLKLRAGRELPAAALSHLRRLEPGDRLFVRGKVHQRHSGWLLWLNHPWQFYREK